MVGVVDKLPDIFMIIISKERHFVIMSVKLTMLYFVMRISMTSKKHVDDSNAGDDYVRFVFTATSTLNFSYIKMR